LDKIKNGLADLCVAVSRVLTDADLVKINGAITKHLAAASKEFTEWSKAMYTNKARQLLSGSEEIKVQEPSNFPSHVKTTKDFNKHVQWMSDLLSILVSKKGKARLGNSATHILDKMLLLQQICRSNNCATHMQTQCSFCVQPIYWIRQLDKRIFTTC
jgi:hypothetical protein